MVQSSDVLQYVWGKLFGKHKIAPILSPSKTVEGFVGGVFSASLLGMLLHWMTPFNAWQAFLMSILICLMGFLGGLVMSAMKRSMGVKDWGEYDQRSWRYFRSYGFALFLRTNFLPCCALFLGLVINHKIKKERY